MGLGGAWAVRIGTAPHRGRGETSRVQPALERAFAGNGRARVLALEEDAQQTRSPGRVLAAQFEGAVVESRVDRCGGSAGLAVAGGQGDVATVAKVTQQLADGVWVEAEGRGNLGRSLATLAALPDGTAEGKRRGCRHGKTSE
jgi:hypothetical protein